MHRRTILFCLDYYYPHVGGAEILFQHLAEGLVRHGYFVQVVTQLTRGSSPFENVNGVAVYRVKAGNSRYRFALLCLPLLLRLARDADLIHTTTFAAALPAWLAAKRQRKPLVLTVHEVWIGQWQRVTDASWLSNAAHEIMERMIYLVNYQNYVTVSQATARALQKIGVAADKITTIHNGVDYDFWNPEIYDGKRLRTQLQLQEQYIFFFSGRPGRSKGLPVLLQAMAKIVDDHPDIALVALLSHAPACQAGLRQARRLISDLNLEAYVHIIPSVPKEDLPNWVALADCVVVPSLSEGFGFAAAEACAMQKPVIVTDNASLPEVVSGNHLLIPPNDVPALAVALRQALQQDFQQTPPRQFHLADNLQNHLDLYARLLPS